MSESELVQQALLHKRKLSVERKNRKREAEAKRKRAIAKARATKGATPSDIKRVAAARGFVVTDCVEINQCVGYSRRRRGRAGSVER